MSLHSETQVHVVDHVNTKIVVIQTCIYKDYNNYTQSAVDACTVFHIHVHVCMCFLKAIAAITRYGSTLYIGIA